MYAIGLTSLSQSQVGLIAKPLKRASPRRTIPHPSARQPI